MYCQRYHQAVCQGKAGGYKCLVEILRGESYCRDHKNRCIKCGDRTANETYCRECVKECEFDECSARINDYSKHCSQHPPQEQARLYKS